MKLLFNAPYKSIGLEAAVELPSFTVLTGVNGAGKSHLLQAIETNAVTIEGVPPNSRPQQGVPPFIRRFDWTTLVPTDTGAFSGGQAASEQSGFWNEIATRQTEFRTQLSINLRQWNLSSLDSLNIKQLRNLKPADIQHLTLCDPQSAAVHKVNLANFLDSADKNLAAVFSNVDPNRERLLVMMSRNAPLHLFSISEEAFYDRFPSSWPVVDLFQQSFARIFASYNRATANNQLKRLAHSQGAAVTSLTDSQFAEKYGAPPWEFVNEIFETSELDFRIDQPQPWQDGPYEPVLTDIRRKTRVKFNDLSSGEKILMSFALCLYHADEPTASTDFPKVLLFDEIDAPLHPSMTRSLLRTIQQVLVKKHNIQVILTTHSPSTVALSPDDTIYVMHKTGSKRISQTSKDSALAILTAGVPTLSVHFENRRQVFVESRYDAQYYGGFYERCKEALASDVSLIFIPSADNGNCDQVKSIVSQLAASGAHTVRGVIDWDLKNTSENSITVLGENDRYSIENYIFDPLLLALLLLREKIRRPEHLGLLADRRFRDMANLSPEEAQQLVSAVVSEIKVDESDADTLVLNYVNGIQVSCSKWVTQMQGHSLEQRIRTIYPQLNKYHGESKLKLAILDFIIDEFPEFIPQPVVSLFRQLQACP